MSNTIKLKRGSGSDPSASDLVVGELAIRTDSGKIFTKKDNGSVAEISGGGGIDDGDKGDITISNGGDTFTIDNGVVTSAKIADGTIVNADINASAAIVGTKISPDFGSQNVATTGTLASGNLTITSTQPFLSLQDSNNENDFEVGNAGGLFRIRDVDAAANRLTISSAGVVDVAQRLDANGGLAVTGDITGTGDLTLTSTDAGSEASPILEFYRNSASPADADYLGQIKFTGEDDAGGKRVISKITGKLDDASEGTVDGLIEFMTRKAGSNNISARLTSTDLKLINGTGLEVAGTATFGGNSTFSTDGTLTTTAAIIVENAQPGISFNDTGANPDFIIQNRDGSFAVRDTTNAANRFLVNMANGNITATGNLVISGLVDGVDIATRDTLFGGLTSSSGVLTNGVTATTQGASDNTTKVATTAYVTTAISNLINNAPSALDTLKELSDALGSDANFSTTVTNSIATKMPLAGGTFTGNITISHTAPKIIFNDTNNNPDYQLINEGGTFLLYDSTNGADKLKVQADGHIDITPNTDFANGIDVTGNVEITSGDVLITDQHPSIRFTDTDAPSGYGHVGVNNTSGSLVLRSDDGNALSGTFMGFEIDGSPKMRLDSTGLGIGTNSPSQKLDVVGSISVSGTVDGRDVASDGSKLDGIESGATADQTASEILTLIKTVDGAGSGLDADTLDGTSSAGFFVQSGSWLGDLGSHGFTRENGLAMTGGAEFVVLSKSGQGHVLIDGTYHAYEGGGFYSYQNSNFNNEIGFYADSTTSAKWTGHLKPNGDSTYDLGSSSLRWTNLYADTLYGDGANITNVNATTLDSIDSGSFLRSDAADTCTQPITFSGGIILPTTGEVIKFGPGTATNDDAHIEWLGGDNAGYLRFSTSDDSDGSGGNEYIEFGDYPTQNRVGTFTQHVRISRDRFLVRTGSNSISQADRLNIASDGTVDIYGNLDVGAGIDVTGNISVSGTVDGRDLATDGSKLDGIESGATADQSASEILTLIKTVDGAGSGLDADTLDGVSSASFLRSDTADTMTGNFSLHGNLLLTGDATTTNQDRTIQFTGFDKEGTTDFTDNALIRHTTNTQGLSGSVLLLQSLNDSNDGIAFYTSNHNNNLRLNGNIIWNAGNDGSGSGLDSDTVDGIQGASLLRSDANDTSSGTVAFGVGTLDPDSFTSHSGGFGGISDGGWGARGVFVHGGGTGDAAAMAHNGSALYFGIQNGSSTNSMATWLQVTPGTRVVNFQTADNANNVQIGGNKVFHAGNDGSGSGLDSDLLDGVEGSSYLRSDTNDTFSGNLTVNGIIYLQDQIRIGDDVFIEDFNVANAFRVKGNQDNNKGFIAFGSQSKLLGCNGASANLTYDGNNILTSASGINASNITSGTIPAARVPTLNQNTTGSAATLTTARTIAGVSFDGSANISLNNNAITNGAGYITSSNSAITNKLPLAGGTMTGELQINARLDVGNGSGNDHEIRIYKADNNVSDHIQFYNGTTRIGEIGCEDGTWLRITQETAKNIYTPRYIRADAGFFVDGTSKGINGSGNFIGGTIAGASDYGTLLRSDTADTASGDISFQGGAGAVSIQNNSDIRFDNGNWTGNAVKIQHHSNYLYISGGSNGIIFREDGSNRVILDGDGHFTPGTDSTYDLGVSARRWRNLYADTLYGDGSNLTGISAGATGGGSDEVFYENDQSVTTNYTITNGKNAMAAGPITINSGVTVTVGSGETLTIV